MPNFYFVLDSMAFALILLTLVFFFGVVYSFTQRYLYSQILTNLHLGITIVALLLLSAIPIYNAFRELQTETFTYFGNAQAAGSRVREITILILVLAQFLFIVNLIAGCIYKLSSKSRNPRMPTAG